MRRFAISPHEYIAFQKYTNDSTIRKLPGIIYVNGFHSGMQNSHI